VRRLQQKERRGALRDAVTVPLVSAANAVVSLFTGAEDEYDVLVAEARKLDPALARELEKTRDAIDDEDG
jgi:hypothetical protein